MIYACQNRREVRTMIDIICKAEAPVAYFECKWCGSIWRASTDEGITPHVIMGQTFPSMPCIVCKGKMTVGKFETEEEAADNDKR